MLLLYKSNIAYVRSILKRVVGDVTAVKENLCEKEKI